MMDLEKEYRDIICYTPLAGKTSEIENVINEKVWSMIEKISQNDSVVIRGGGIHTEQIMEVIRKKYTKEEFLPIAIVDNGQVGSVISGIAVISQEEAANIIYDTVVILSYTYAEEMKKGYSADQYKILDIYQELKEDNIFLTAPFYFYKKKNYEIALYHVSKYKEDSSKKNLESVIDATLELKDFHAAFSYIDKYIELGFDENGLYQNIRFRFEELFDKVKQVIAARTGKDIVMFWIDGVPYVRLEWLPFVYSKKEKSCFFEYVYTVTPYTHPTMHTMLQGALGMDDYDVCKQEITKENSEVIQNLEKAGYQYLYIGYEADKHISQEYRIERDISESHQEEMVSACSMYWRMLCELINAEKPVFYMVHSVAETHYPYMALNLDDTRSYNPDVAFESGQTKLAYQYVDSQVEFYSEFLDNKITKIYMGDHGMEFNQWRFVEERLRTFFLVEGEKIKSQKIGRIFSYQNFKSIVKWLISNADSELQEALSDYALVQDVDIYASALVKLYRKRNTPEFGMAFRGVVTKEDKYIRIGNGKEFYYRLEGMGETEKDVFEYQESLEELRKKAGTVFLDRKQYAEFDVSEEFYR